MIDSLRDFAVLVAALATAPIAVATVLKLPKVNRPARYLARVLISDPLAIAIEPIVVQALERSQVLKEIDRAVNTRHPDAPTLSDDMTEVVERLRRGDDRFERLEARIEEVAEVVKELT